MEEVLPAVQQARGPQGIEVTVATEALVENRKGIAGRFTDFLREVRGEIQKVTWPTVPELRKATIVIVIFVTILGILIGLLDALLQLTFVTGIARLFS